MILEKIGNELLKMVLADGKLRAKVEKHVSTLNTVKGELKNMERLQRGSPIVSNIRRILGEMNDIISLVEVKPSGFLSKLKNFIPSFASWNKSEKLQVVDECMNELEQEIENFQLIQLNDINALERHENELVEDTNELVKDISEAIKKSVCNIETFQLFNCPIKNPFGIVKTKAKQYAHGTRDWIFDDIQEWYCTKSRCMVLLGPAGYGKSVIVGNACVLGGLLEGMSNEMNRMNRRFIVGATHFFKHDDNDTQNLMYCFQSIANQLAGLIPEFHEQVKEVVKSIDVNETDVSTMFHRILSNPLGDIQNDFDVIIILDALDELRENQKLLHILSTRWITTMPSWIKLLITSRSDDRILEYLRPFEPISLRVDDAKNLQDVKTFLSSQIKPYLKDQSELEKALLILTSRCEGSFLYAFYLHENLAATYEEKSLDLRDIQDKETIPLGVDGIYKDYFGRFLADVLQGDKFLYNQLLATMAVAREPISKDFLSQILKFNGELDDFLVKISVLLTVTEKSVRFSHKSALDFLVDKNRAGRNLYILKADGHRAIADTFLKNPISTKFALRHGVYHLCENSQMEEAAKFLLDFDWLEAALISGVDPIDLVLDSHAIEELDAVLVIRSLEKGMNALRREPRLLASQLIGRLDQEHPIISNCVPSGVDTWLCPLSKTLIPATDPLRKILRGHSQYVVSVAIDGDRIVSASEDSTVKVWDIKTGRCIQTLEELASNVVCVAIDGGTIVYGLMDATIQVQDTRAESLIRMLHGHTDKVWCVAIKGTIIASGSEDKTVRVWGETGSCIHILKGHSTSVDCIAIANNTIVSGAEDRTVKLWGISNGVCLQTFQGHTQCVTSVAMDGGKIVSVSNDDTLKVWDIDNGECLQTMQGHGAQFSCVAIEGDTIVSGSFDSTVKVWDAQTGKCLEIFQGHSFSVSCVSIEGSTIVSGSMDKTVKVWTTNNNGESNKAPYPDFESSVVLFEGNTIVSSCKDKTLRVWDGKNGKLLQKLQGHTDTVRCIAIDGNMVVSGSADETVRVWDVQSGKCIQIIKVHINTLCCLAVNGGMIVSCTGDENLKVWNINTGKCLQTLQGHTEKVTCVAIEGNTIASGSKDKHLKLWDTKTGKCVKTLLGHTDSVLCVAIKGTIIVSGSEDRTVKVWEAGKCIQTLEGHTDLVCRITIDGSTILSESGYELLAWEIEVGNHLYSQKQKIMMGEYLETFFSVDGVDVGYELDAGILGTTMIRNGRIVLITGNRFTVLEVRGK